MKRKTAGLILLLLVVAVLAFFAGYALGETNRSGTIEVTARQSGLTAQIETTLLPADTPTEKSAATEQTTRSGQTKGLLDLNTAGKEELMELPGIGEVLAERIIAYRQEIGGFTAVEDLLNVEGIGEKRLDAICDLITVEAAYEDTGS